MTTPAVNSYNKYQGNGSTTEFSISFPYLSQSYVKVYVKRNGMEEELMDSSDYSFVNSTTLKFPSTTSSETVLATGDVITIQRETPLANQYEFSNQKRLFPEDVMGADDLDMQILQEQGRELSRAVKVSPTSSVEPEELIKEVEAIYDAVDAIEEIAPDLPNINTVANNISDVNTVAGSIGDINDVADNLSNITAVKNNATNINAVAGNATNINTVAGKTSEITTVAGISSEVATVAGISANVTSVAGNATNINAVAGNATNINAVNANKTNIDTVASNSTNINTVAGISSDVTTTAGLASDIAVVVSLKDDIPVVVQAAEDIDKVEDIAADITTVAGISSDVSTVATISSSVSTVSSNISNVNSVAGNASNINSVASNSSNINSVATNISNVNTVATNASSINTCASNIPAINDAPNQAAAAAASAELSAQYANDKINQTHISNCITAIPQDIKLELNAGTLTLKSGSKVYVPNGSDVFNTISIASDLTQSSFSTGANTEYYLFYYNGYLRYFSKAQISSGSTAPSGQNYLVWYDTTNNTIKTSSNGGSTWVSGVSLPLCKFTATSDTITSIDQVFNGFGYIGSTIFALPGVKGLIPNGRNADGTLKSNAFTTSSVITSTNAYSYSGLLALNQSAFDASSYTNYNEKDNYYYSDTGVVVQRCIVGTFVKGTNGVVTSFKPKPTFHVADYNDFKQLKDTNVDYKNITNCLTETPTDVRVTVSNYNPVIKAGSIAYFPNGFSGDGTTKKFSSLKIASDTSCSQTSQAGTVRLLCVDTDGNSYGALKGGYDVTSLPGSPTNYYLYYHTGENKIYLYNGSAWKQVSFPFAMYVEAQTNVNPDIKEIYNTIGIMNDWVFARPGIKGLIPNGRNADGTLNNESFETKNVLMKKPTTVRDVYLSSSEIYFYSGNVYDEKTNYNSIGQYCFVGTVFANTNLNSVSAPKTCDYSASKQSFKAVDSNDIENIEQNFLSENGDSYFLNKAEKPEISVLSDGRISCKRFKYYVPTLQGYRERYFREYTTNSAPSCEAGRDAFVFINQSGTLSFLSCYRCYTGSSQPVSPYTYALWYNGATISFTSNAGSTWTQNNSIPLAVLEVDSNGTPKRVKHLFSDVAFFGNVIFQKNFVKYKNSWRTGINAIFYSDGDYVIDTMQFRANHYFEQDEQPTVNNCIWKQISTDKIFYKNSTGNISETDTMVMGKVSVRSGLVTSFTPRDKFVIADRNNILSLIATGDDYIGSRQFGAIIEEGTYYLKFSSGKMIQFGVTDSINSGSVSQVSLPKPFASADYFVTGLTQSGHSGSISSYSASHGVAGNYSTTQFDVKNCGSYSAAYDWIAIGHWK